MKNNITLYSNSNYFLCNRTFINGIALILCNLYFIYFHLYFYNPITHLNYKYILKEFPHHTKYLNIIRQKLSTCTSLTNFRTACSRAPPSSSRIEKKRKKKRKKGNAEANKVVASAPSRPQLARNVHPSISCILSFVPPSPPFAGRNNRRRHQCYIARAPRARAVA